jgi:hypothetical protein
MVKYYLTENKVKCIKLLKILSIICSQSYNSLQVTIKLQK